MRVKVIIKTELDIVVARHTARKATAEIGFSLVDQTRIITAVSELARNIYNYAGEGWMEWQQLAAGDKKGVEFVFRDRGPGIADVELAMTAGYSSGKGLGLGLSGARRLVDEFKLESSVGIGTTVSIVKWLV